MSLTTGPTRVALVEDHAGHHDAVSRATHQAIDDVALMRVFP